MRLSPPSSNPEGVHLSVIVPTFNRPVELRMCLEGFAGQSVSKEQFEVVVVDDGSEMDIESVSADFKGRVNLAFLPQRHTGLAAARNAGIARARAPLVILYDDDLRPLPELVEYCLEFHCRLPGERDMALLYFTPDASIANEALVQWVFDELYLFPSTGGVHGFGSFWGGAVTCKKSVFRHALFDPSYLSVEDAEFAARLSLDLDLRVHFEHRQMSTMTRSVTLPQIVRREFLRGYYHYRLSREHPAAWRFDYPPYDRPDAHSIRDPARVAALLSAAIELERANGHSPATPLLCAMWRKALLHARASGWLAARDGHASP